MAGNRQRKAGELTRSRSGQYSHGMQSVCTCGHRKGDHTATSPHECTHCGCAEFLRSSRRPRTANPLNVRRLYNIVTATKGNSTKTLFLNKKLKFSRSEVNAKRFPNADAALRCASGAVREHPELRAYHFSIRFAYG